MLATRTKHMFVVPEQIYERIEAFAIRIANSSAMRIDVAPSPDAEPLNCSENVARATKSNGGEVLKGWRVWWIPNVLIEAQAHVVWQRSDGTVVDVTPNEDGETECVFIPDRSMSANPGVDYVPSVYENLTDENVVDRYIECARVVSDHQDREYTCRIQMTPPPEALEMVNLLPRLAELAGERRW